MGVKARNASVHERSALGRALSGPQTDRKVREIERGVSPAVKRAVDQSIRDNREALRKLEKA